MSPTASPPDLQQPFGHIINGKLIIHSERRIDVINPAIEMPLASVPVATSEVIKRRKATGICKRTR